MLDPEIYNTKVIFSNLNILLVRNTYGFNGLLATLYNIILFWFNGLLQYNIKGSTQIFIFTGCAVKKILKKAEFI